MEDRIERLEAITAEQERLLEQLNEVVYNQQKQIDDLEKLLDIMAHKFKELAEASEMQTVDTPPPHYGR